MALSEVLRRWAPTDQGRADRAEAKAFRDGFNRRGLSKNRKSQLLLTLAVCATFVGGSLSLVGSYVGFGLFIVGLPATVAIGVWCLRNWDY
jgi:hypothetical protein